MSGSSRMPLCNTEGAGVPLIAAASRQCQRLQEQGGNKQCQQPQEAVNM